MVHPDVRVLLPYPTDVDESDVAVRLSLLAEDPYATIDYARRPSLTEATRGSNKQVLYQVDRIREELIRSMSFVPVEGRYHFGSTLFVFGKVAPGAAIALASVKDGSAPNELSGTAWAFSADASIGGSILLGPRQQMDKRTVRFWLTPEIGYAYMTSASVRLNPDRAEKDVLGSDEDTQLGTLALRGIFWRASLGMTF